MRSCKNCKWKDCTFYGREDVACSKYENNLQNDFNDLKKCELLFDALMAQEQIYKARKEGTSKIKKED